MQPDSLILETIRRVLAERRMSRRELARLAGLNPSTVSRVLAGRRAVTLRFLERVAEPLGLDLSGFICSRQGRMLHFLQEQGISEDFWPRVVHQFITAQELAAGRQGEQELASSMPALIDAVSDPQLARRLTRLWEVYRRREAPDSVHRLAGGALYYWMTEQDVIPDRRLPLGYLDDVIVVGWVEEALRLNTGIARQGKGISRIGREPSSEG